MFMKAAASLTTLLTSFSSRRNLGTTSLNLLAGAHTTRALATWANPQKAKTSTTTTTLTATSSPQLGLYNDRFGKDIRTMKIPKEELTNDYYWGMIGNGRTCALIDAHGKIVFSCLPSFDSGTAFASILDEENGGSFSVEMVDGEAVGQSYEKDTNILVTTFEGPTGSFELIDFMPRFSQDEGYIHEREDLAPDIIRKIRVLQGKPRIKVNFDPRLEYGQAETRFEVRSRSNVIKAITNWTVEGAPIYESVYLWSDMDLEAIRNHDEIKLNGDKYLYLSYNDKVETPSHDLVDLMLQRTRAFWMLWSARTRAKLPFQYQDYTIRSALVLGMLQFGPTGAFLAAATTSLPESIGEERNWDYRFCWLRDASMTVATLSRIGHNKMATSFVDWMMRTVPTKDDSLQIMYGIRGEKILTEKTFGHLSGYKGSQPVRIGNAAYTQQQHDIFGVVMDVIYKDLLLFHRAPEGLDRIWTRVRSIARHVADEWQQPDRGIWEIRGEKRHFVFSKVLCWVAIDRAIKIAKILKKDEWANSMQPLLDQMHESICENGWDDNKKAFTQAYNRPDLDASNLLMAEYGFIEPTDPRFVSTVERTKEELCVDGLMFRYRNEDDFGEPSSAFTVCSFWLVKALASIGQREAAEELFQTLLDSANMHGLYGEDLDFKTRRQLGNFPQAYSHLALIDCAIELSKASEEEKKGFTGLHANGVGKDAYSQSTTVSEMSGVHQRSN